MTLKKMLERRDEDLGFRKYFELEVFWYGASDVGRKRMPSKATPSVQRQKWMQFGSLLRSIGIAYHVTCFSPVTSICLT